MADKRIEDILHKVEAGRRDFVKKALVGTAFAAPIVTSFSMDGLKLGAGQAFAATSNVT